MYTIEVNATKDFEDEGRWIHTAVRFAEDTADWLTIAAEFAREKFPPTEGWYNHKMELRLRLDWQKQLDNAKAELKRTENVRKAAAEFGVVAKKHADDEATDLEYEAGLYKLIQAAIDLV